MARVTEGELDAIRYGFIDRKGVMVIKAKYVYANDFHEDLALAAISVKGGLKIGFIDKQGRWKIKPRFGSATDFSEGYACVADEGTLSLFEGNLLYQPDGTVGKAYYIDKNGKRAFQGHFDSCGALSEGLAPVEINDKWQFIDRTGKVAITTNFPSSSDIATFSEGLAAVNSAGGAKFIDKNGKVVIETPFDWADKFVNGIARVKRAQKNGTVSSGYIDRAGKVIWEPSE